MALAEHAAAIDRGACGFKTRWGTLHAAVEGHLLAGCAETGEILRLLGTSACLDTASLIEGDRNGCLPCPPN